MSAPPPPAPARPAATQAEIARGVAWSGAAQAIIALADVVSQMIVLWVLGFHDIGVGTYAVAFYTALDTAADLGVTSALIQKDEPSPDQLATVFWFNVLVSGGLFLLLLAIAPLYAWSVHEPVVAWLLIAYGGKLLFQNVYAIPFARLKKAMRFDEIAKGRTLAHLGESVARVALALGGVTVWCITLAALVRVVLFGAFIQARHPFVPRWTFRPRQALDYLRFGLRSGAAQILYQVYTNLDYAVVGHYFGAAALGVYKYAYEIVLEPVRSITNVVSDVAFPTFARLRHEPARLADQLARFTRLNFTTVLPFLVVIALAVDDGVKVLANKAPEDLALLADCCRILCFVGVLRAIGFLGPPLLDGIGRPGLTLRYMAFTAAWLPAAFVVGARLLGGALGARAVAVAWAAGYPVAFAVLAYLVVRSIDLPVGRYLRANAGMAACSLAGLAVGEAARLAAAGLPAPARLAVVVGAALATILLLMTRWQGLSVAGIKASMRGDGPGEAPPGQAPGAPPG